MKRANQSAMRLGSPDRDSWLRNGGNLLEEQDVRLRLMDLVMLPA